VEEKSNLTGKTQQLSLIAPSLQAHDEQQLYGWPSVATRAFTDASSNSPVGLPYGFGVIFYPHHFCTLHYINVLKIARGGISGA
jgi:hypothetical protein